ncbi:PREDICTED: uncharacterized protein LOC105460721 [Wasmannia auropunctata]|uniref:uncharacterized protein LOC105460721 n=1 Tax=Wasmannia auropunctata TaxID=64793 RepID=UPI0005EEFC56|nr:PREDICTED: uncharacterized protein LOC105460721 [Wasmannia auropunctata]
MTKNIRTILKPFLIISYVFGLRIADLPINRTKLWISFLYMLLIWIVYYCLLISPLVYSVQKSYSIEYHICYYMEILISLLSIMFGVYNHKKFQNCLKKLDIIDNTLLELGTVTDYDKLRKKILWHILGWFIIVILMNSVTALSVNVEHDCDILTAIIVVFIRNYSYHVNVIGYLTTTNILGYIGLKFDQINKHLQNLTTDNDHKIKQVRENLIRHSYRCRFLKTLNTKRTIWIIRHLHLELRKVSYEIDSIFVTDMSFKMGSYFGWIIFLIRETFCALIGNLKYDKILYAATNVIWISHNIFKFLLVNYMCETVSTKANATGHLLNKLLYSTYDDEVREVISQFSLQMVFMPLRFYGIGLFQFGFKYLHRFIMSIVTVLVIVIQAREDK